MRINLSENHEFSIGDKFLLGSQKILICTAFIFSLSACNSSKQGSLIDDYNANSNCPQTGCADLSPKSDSVYLLRDANKTINLGARDSIIEISGTCSVSTYPNNRIEVSHVSSGANVSPVSINLGTSSTIPKCSMGQFHIYVNACAFPGIGNIRLNLSLKPLDSAGQVVPDTSADVLVNVYRSAAVITLAMDSVNGVCP